MAIKILSAKDFNVKLKATIQASGRLGFSEPTAKFLKLSLSKYAIFANDEETNDLYLAICENESEDSFEIKSTSGYYYVPAKMLFDVLGLDYINNVIMFDLVRVSSLDEETGGETYKMNKRENKRKSKENENITE